MAVLSGVPAAQSHEPYLTREAFAPDGFLVALSHVVDQTHIPLCVFNLTPPHTPPYDIRLHDIYVIAG